MQPGIMIDIETLGTSSKSAILSIGAVEFDKYGKFVKEFEVKIDPDTCVQAGLIIEPRTVFWWLEQSEEARRSILTGKRISLIEALTQLTDAFDWKGKQVWANGVNFDISILDNAFGAFNCLPPWKYWDVMDYRTVKNIVPRDMYEAKKFEAAVKHSALEDAKAQANTLIAITHWMENLYDQLDLKKAA